MMRLTLDPFPLLLISLPSCLSQHQREAIDYLRKSPPGCYFPERKAYADHEIQYGVSPKVQLFVVGVSIEIPDPAEPVAN